MIINVTRSSMPSFDEYLSEINDIWETRWLTNMGEKHQALESALKDYLGVPGLTLFCNGHLALELCIQAYELKGEVITTPFTFASTTHSIARNGLRPVFCDVKQSDFTIDADKIESLITDETCAILPVHVYGNICDVASIEEIANHYNLKVIYDAAHAFGVTYEGKKVGTFGDASIFSFHATKVFNTIEGGACCYSDSEIGRRLNNLKNFGIQSEEIIESVGSNAKMNEFAAAMGLCNLRHVDEEIAKRGKVYALYQEILSGISGLRLPAPQKGTTPNYAYFPALIDEDEFGISRDDMRDRLWENGINARKYFYPLTSSFSCYKNLFKPEDTPTALKASLQVLSLPIYAGLSNSDVERVCEVIIRAKGEKSNGRYKAGCQENS